jgi:hypothetical protein
MKTVSFIILLNLSPVFVFPQLSRQNPLPQGSPLRALCYTDINTGYFAGDFGVIVKTSEISSLVHIQPVHHINQVHQ